MAENSRYIGTRYLESVPEVLNVWIAENTGDEVWGAMETGSERVGRTLWFVASRSQNALVTATQSGRSWEHLQLTGVTHARTNFARKSFELDGRELFTVSRLSKSRLDRLFELAFQPRDEGLFAAACDHIEAKQYSGADELLTVAEAMLSDDHREGSVAFLSLEQKIHLAQAHCALRLGRDGDAVVMLAAVSDARPGDDLLRATRQMHDLDGSLLTLALAHEEAGQPASAARVYARLHEDEPETDVLLLSQARAFGRAGDSEAAIAAYDEFVERRARSDVALATEAAEASDVAAACLESARLLQSLGRPTDAAKRYLTMIRHAPFEVDGYAQMFELHEELDDVWSIKIAGEVLRLLKPEALTEIGDAPTPHQPVELPCEYESLSDDDHDERVVHRGERVSSTLAQKWIGALTRDERDTRELERHAQRVEDETVLALLASVARLVDVDVPRLYLSHGSAGVEVLGTDEPFVLLGACHLDETNDLRLDIRELAFTLATQVEHIRADHVLLTSSEFWRTFGTKSATALLAFLPLGDLVSRLTDGSLLKWVKKLGGSSSGKIRSALELVEQRIADGATGSGVQSAYTATLAKLRSSTLQQQDEPSLVRERLADFARAAQYTADRVGLLAADDVRAAVTAMVRLSPSLCEYTGSLEKEGLVGLLAAADDDPALEEFVLRVGELLKFALSDDYARLRSALVA